jgi:hypothetical protein
MMKLLAFALDRKRRLMKRKRKRKNLQHLGYDSSEYWNRVLAQEGLSMSQGEHPKLVNMSPDTLEIVERYQSSLGRKLPKKASE